MLLLFDIDGTLISAGGAGRRALARAFEAVVGVAGAMEGLRLDGNTDPMILAQAFERHVGRPAAGEAENAAILERYLGFLLEELAHAGSYRVLPGALELAQAARASGRAALGLATGNIERGARLKLEAARLNPFFPFGGFGSDAPARAELVRRGIERGQRWAEAHLGRRFSASDVWVIGDTERDVAAAREVGVAAVGVLAGAGQPEVLEAARPDLLVESLADPVLWRALGLAPG